MTTRRWTVALLVALLGTMPLHAQKPAPKPAAQTEAKPDTRPQCKGATKAGVQCKRRFALLKNGYCSQHQSQAPTTK